ncbi:MAG: type II secretion system protein [Thiobacillus sp.]|nr:type II secretion system protein [Thiobacillus sp.]
MTSGAEPLAQRSTAAIMLTGKSAQTGFSYLFVLMLIALIGFGLALAGTLWSTDAQRAREADLLFIGEQYRQAIRSYYELDSAQPRLPQSIDELLEDNRRPNIVRHLRRGYRDPLTRGEFEAIRAPDTNGILGVYSRSTGKPFKQTGFFPEQQTFSKADSYSEWRFEFIVPVVQPVQVKEPNNPDVKAPQS